MIKEVWLNIYNYGTAYIYGSDLYKTPKSATRALCDKKHYSHTVNVVTGEIVKVKIKKKAEVKNEQ